MSRQRYDRTYRFGPLEVRGPVAGLRPSQLVTLAIAAALAVAIFRRTQTLPGFMGALSLMSAAAATAWAPVSGRTLLEWMPVVARWAALGVQGRRQSLSPTSQTWPAARSAPQLAVVDGCKVIGLPLAEGLELGVLRDAKLHADTAVLAARVRAFGLLPADEQERRLDRWGRVLASLASERRAVRRLQIIERTLPHDSRELAAWCADTVDPARDEEDPLRRSYDALLANASAVSQDHEVLVALQVHSSSRNPDSAAVLVREIKALAGRLEQADVAVDGVLTARELHRVLRRGFDPFEDDQHRERPKPWATETLWDRFRCDGAQHRTYWIAQWPRLDVSPAFLAPLLLGAQSARSISVVVEPVAPTRSRGAVEAAITSDEADELLREERGFRTTARRRKQQAATRRRENELADGHEELRFAGFVTVSARHDEDLDAAADTVLESAHQAYLDLQLMWGEQDQAFVFGCLPLCRGLRDGSMLGGT